MPIVVVPYDEAWPTDYETIRARVWPVVADVALTIEHVGSTSVPGLAAKPIIDVDVVVEDASSVQAAIERLAAIGYAHQGDLGVTGREAFAAPRDAVAQHLYVCGAGSLALSDHLALRDHLRSHPADAAAYGALKMRLAAGTDDIDAYIAGKTDCILDMLAAAGLSRDDLATLEAVNRPSVSAGRRAPGGRGSG